MSHQREHHYCSQCKPYCQESLRQQMAATLSSHSNSPGLFPPNPTVPSFLFTSTNPSAPTSALSLLCSGLLAHNARNPSNHPCLMEWALSYTYQPYQPLRTIQHLPS